MLSEKSCVLIYPNNHIKIISSTPPLGILYLASYLKEKEIKVSIYDFQNDSQIDKKKLFEILDKKPKVIGLSCNISNFKNGLKLAKFFKTYNKKIKIIVGGPLPTSSPKIFLDDGNIDAVCNGEGEITLYQYFKKGNSTRGLFLKKDGEIISTGKSQVISDLNKIPFPSFNMVNLNKYHMIFQKDKPLSGIITSRGCPYHCKFCFHGVFGYKWRARSPKNILKEIKYQVNSLGVNEICVWDDNFTLDQKRTEKLCDLIIEKKNLDFLWQCTNGIRTDRVSFKTLYKMRNAGCWNVGLAPESGDQKIIQKIGKNLDIDQIFQVREWCKKLGIFTGLYLILGLPFENEESRVKTMKFLKVLDPDYVSAHIYVPFPGTELVEQLNLKIDLNHAYKTGNIDSKLKNYLHRINSIFYLNPKHLINILQKVGFQYTTEALYYYLKANL